MWRTRGPRPCRGPRCCSISLVALRQAVKSQLHDGCVSADPSSSHVGQSRSALGLQVSIQHLPTRPPEVQHALPLHGPASNSDGIDLPTLQLQERPAAGNGGDCSCECEPSTSTSGRTDDGLADNGRRRNQFLMNSRGAAALTRRITHTRSTSELQAVLQQYWSQLNPIHISAAIVKLAKLTAFKFGRRTLRHGLLAAQGQQQWAESSNGRRQVLVAADEAAASDHDEEGGGAQRVCGPASSSDPVFVVDIGVAAAAAADALRRVKRRGGSWDEGQASSGSSDNDSISNDSSTSRPSTFSSGSQSSGEQSMSERGSQADVQVNCTQGADHSATAKVNVSEEIPGDAGSWQPSDGIPAPLHHPRQQGRAAATVTHEAHQPSAALLADLVSGFLMQLPHYTVRQYANVVWALGSMGSHEHTKLLQATAVQLQAEGGAKLLAASPQELANLALGLAKLGYREVSLWGAIIATGKARLQGFKPQELHNMAWAVAAASQDRSMISAAVQVALPQLRSFNASGLSNLLWACATAQCHCEELFEGAAAALMALPPQELNCQDVANTAWAYAKLQHNHPELMAHLARLVAAAGAAAQGDVMLQSAATQELVNTLWAFAVLPLPLSLQLSLDPLHAPLLPQPGEDEVGAAMAGGDGGINMVARGLGAVGLGLPGSDSGDAVLLAERHHQQQQKDPQDARWQAHWAAASRLSDATPGKRSPSGQANSSATLGPQTHGSSSSCTGTNSSSNSRDRCSSCSNTPGLLESAVRVLVSELSRRQDLTPQGASNALWACARLQPCPLPPGGLAVLMQTATRCCGRMGDQELSNTLWALAEMRNAGLYVADGDAEVVFAAACGAARLEAMAPSAIAQLVHAAVALRRVATGDMDLLAQHLLRRMPLLRPQELCVVAVAVAEAVRISKYCHPILLNGLANAAVACVGELCPQGISTLLWSFARAKHYHGPLTTALCRTAKPRLREFSDMEISNLVCALAVLKCQDRQLLVHAARVMVERVRLRRQRRAATLRQQQPHAASLLPQRSPARQLQNDQSLQGQLMSVLERTPVESLEESGEEEAGQQRQREEHGQLLSERAEMASVLASHRQQQRRRRQQQQRQSMEAESSLAEVAAVTHQHSKTGAAVDDGDGLPESKLWGRAGSGAGWDACGLRQQYAAEPRAPGVAVSTLPGPLARSVDGSGPLANSDPFGGSTLAAAMATLPTRAATAQPLPRQPEPRLGLRHLPSLHHHHHHQHHDSAVALQPRRPPPREECSREMAVAADDRRRGTTAPSAAVPRCIMGSLDSGGGPGVLPQRAASFTDDSDGDAGLGGAAGGAGPTPCDHAKSMSKLLWSYSKCNLYNQSLFRLLVQELQPVLRHTNPHELALALWAVACHGHHCPEFLDAAAALMLRGRLKQLCAWDASVVAWAYAKLGHQDRGLFEALQEHARAIGDKYREPSLMRLAWACAALDVPLQEDLVRRVVDLKQQARRRAALSSYEDADREVLAGGDAARVEGSG